MAGEATIAFLVKREAWAYSCKGGRIAFFACPEHLRRAAGPEGLELTYS